MKAACECWGSNVILLDKFGSDILRLSRTLRAQNGLTSNTRPFGATPSEIYKIKRIYGDFKEYWSKSFEKWREMYKQKK